MWFDIITKNFVMLISMQIYNLLRNSHVLSRQLIEMLHDQQRVSVGNHLLPLIFQWNIGINFFGVIDIFKVFLCLQQKLFCAAFQKMLNKWYHSFNFQFSIATSFFQRTCNKKNLHALIHRTNSTPIHQKVLVVLRDQVQQ